MIKHIGGEFGRVFSEKKTENYVFDSQKMRYFMSGRTALYGIFQDILKKGYVKKAFLPSYCSRSMIEPIIDQGILVEFYNVIFDGRKIVIRYDYNNKCDCVLLMDYFGFCNDEIILIASHARQNGKIVIIDKTQSLLCDRNYESMADYTFASYRKWFASSAAVAYAKYGFLVEEPHRVNYNYERLRESGFEVIEREGYHSTILDDSEIMLRTDYKDYCPSENEINFTCSQDYMKFRALRKRNAQHLFCLLKNVKEITVACPEQREIDCPLYLPVLVNDDINRDSVIAHLLENHMECYVHWGISMFHEKSSYHNRLYTKEISLFCDQRYDVEDMDKIVNALKNAILRSKT